MTVATAAATATVPRIRPRLAGVSFFANLLGALLTFFYFRFVDTAAARQPAGTEIAYFVVGLACLLALGMWRVRRWAAPLWSWSPALNPDEVQRVRRRALMLPYGIARVTLIGWVLAGVIWGIVWPWLDGSFSLGGALRVMFGITVIAGSVTTAFTFLATEHVWRRRLPRFFPAGDLSATRGALRVPVRTRLLLIFLLVSVVPLTLVGIMCYTRAAALLEVDRVTAADRLAGMLFVILFMLAAGSLSAIALAVFASRSVAAPLRDVEAAMREVEGGNLHARAAVVSNDEIGGVAEGFNRMVDGLRERERIRDTFGKYVTREIRDEILAGRVALEGQSVEATILFADLRDFTPWVESHAPREVVLDLNGYFTLMDAAIREHGGLVLQFIGDEIEAVFGAPVADARHADRAVGAALEMRRRLAVWNDDRRQRGRVPLCHGIGIHTGQVLAGNIGSPDRVSYALVGDAVNLASRLQELTKELGSDVLVSGDTARRLTVAYPVERVSAVVVKGRSTEVEVYRVA